MIAPQSTRSSSDAAAPFGRMAGGRAGSMTRWRDALGVYLQKRVLIVLFLGFSSGLPLALSGSTLLV